MACSWERMSLRSRVDEALENLERREEAEEARETGEVVEAGRGW